MPVKDLPIGSSVGLWSNSRNKFKTQIDAKKKKNGNPMPKFINGN